jgi:hypothetical protein
MQVMLMQCISGIVDSRRGAFLQWQGQQQAGLIMCGVK